MTDHREVPTPGPGVDAENRPVVDPTANVLSLVEAAVRRTDDLADLRHDFIKEKVSDLGSYFKEVNTLRSEHNKELRQAESSRLDSIRQVDREEVAKATTAAQNAIQALATTTSTLAETLRGQVATTAAAAAEQLAGMTNTIGTRLSALERAQAEGTGKQAIADPQLASLIVEMRALTGVQKVGEGKGLGVGMIIAVIVGLVATFGTIINIILNYAVMK